MRFVFNDTIYDSIKSEHLSALFLLCVCFRSVCGEFPRGLSFVLPHLRPNAATTSTAVVPAVAKQRLVFFPPPGRGHRPHVALCLLRNC